MREREQYNNFDSPNRQLNQYETKNEVNYNSYAKKKPI